MVMNTTLKVRREALPMPYAIFSSSHVNSKRPLGAQGQLIRYCPLTVGGWSLKSCSFYDCDTLDMFLCLSGPQSPRL